ncbi:MAG: TetR/AcrR family transcriptional regulator [Bacteroidaceae bacterium]|nr:TetR/AcrR family transcriptional regulator [Bacteroidaceae bacterium]
MENRIIDAARAVFIEKGYAETSMSEIAAKAGINRPALHYYFRTKDKMFQAVFGSIVSSVIPKVFDAIMHKEKSVADRTECIIDAYYSLFINTPQLPLFMLRELNRDPEMLIKTILGLNVADTMRKAISSLQEEMDEGKLKKVPLQFIFFNFYSLLTFPFLTIDISRKVFENNDDTLRESLTEWKKNIVFQMENLLKNQEPVS